MKKKSKTILEEKGKNIIFTFGRFQPPTAGHKLLMDKVKSVAKKEKAEHRIYTSSTNDKKRNPLNHKEKVSYMKKFFRGMNISTDSSIRTPFEALQSLSDEGYKHVIMVVGGDRVDEFRKGVVKYIGDDGYQFDSFNVVSAGKRDPDAEDVTGMSASKMRKAASDGDFATFVKGLPSTSNITLSRKLYNSLRKRMKITEKVDNINKKKNLPVEDGTDESRENRQSLTPGQPVEKYTKNNNNENMMKYTELLGKLPNGVLHKKEIIREEKKSFSVEFSDERKAKAFAKDITNSAVATATVNGKKVTIKDTDSNWSSVDKSTFNKFLKKHKGIKLKEDISPKQAKKLGIDMPLSGKGYPYNEEYINKPIGENMKTYKDFKETISEQGEYTPSGMKHTGMDAKDSIVPLHDIGNPEAMGAVNAFIEQYTSQEYMNPRQAVAQLRARLNTVGLHFDFQPSGAVTEGTEEYPLTLFGGRSGWDIEKGGVSEDDGITPKIGYGLSMQIEYTIAESGMYRIGAKIIKKSQGE